MLKRLLLFLLILSFSLGMTSCGLIVINKGSEFQSERETESESGEESEKKEANPIETEDYMEKSVAYLSAVRESDFDGVAVTVALYRNSPVPSEYENSVDVAKYERNKRFQDKYNTKLLVNTCADADTLNEAIRESVLSGDYYCDIALPSVISFSALYANNCLLNLNTLPFTDFTADYYNQSSVETYTINNSLRAVSGAFSEDIRGCFCVFYEKKSSDDILYRYALDGSLTWEKLLEYVKNENGDTDFISSCYGVNGLGDVMFASTGEKYLTQSDGVYYVSFDDGNSQSICDYFNGILSSWAVFSSEESSEAFYDGRSSIMISKLDSVKDFSAKAEQWGILPVPKYSIEQESYCSLADYDSLIMCVPAGSSNLDRVGMALEALNASSYGVIREAVIKEYINENIRDNGSVSMLYLIPDTVVYDLAFSIGGNYDAVASGTYRLFRSCVQTDDNLALGVKKIDYWISSELKTLY